ncbi:uncharacterized protein EI97DRAFT_458556 [Westerdykella ornata]|uniref:Proteinase inhibitor I78 n=1 Tax=Westerdykella ornata TaxID=318751 RepID=A0A6A6JHL8_WESOR|nr:uncharacterized protein EI97DRAFT_458556 [Westerdykella ornata]KAF2276051.1 hypothetical protein EI97DRAFT_458556 [Westerdykella ornata]
MPLVVPGLQTKDPASSAQSAGGENNKEEWMSKLMGKKLGDVHDEVTFAKQDLPQRHRIVPPNSFQTTDFVPERLNVHVDEDGTVRGVKFG